MHYGVFRDDGSLTSVVRTSSMMFQQDITTENDVFTNDRLAEVPLDVPTPRRIATCLYGKSTTTVTGQSLLLEKLSNCAPRVHPLLHSQDTVLDSLITSSALAYESA